MDETSFEKTHMGYYTRTYLPCSWDCLVRLALCVLAYWLAAWLCMLALGRRYFAGVVDEHVSVFCSTTKYLVVPTILPSGGELKQLHWAGLL
jgi:hypothetical protein